MGSAGQSAGGAARDLLRRRQSRDRDLPGTDHRAGDRRTSAGARRRNRPAGVGIACRVSAGPLHHHDGAAHRERESDHRRERRRSPDARILRRLRRDDRADAPGASTPCPAIRRSRSRIRRSRKPRRRGTRTGGREAAAAPCGTGWRTTRRPSSSTSAPATRSRGRSICDRRRTRTTSTSPRFLPCTSTPAS